MKYYMIYSRPAFIPCFHKRVVVDLDTHVRFLADDTSLYIIVDTPVNDALKLKLSLCLTCFVFLFFSTFVSLSSSAEEELGEEDEQLLFY